MSTEQASRLLQPKTADRDIEHEQISSSTDEQLAARRAEIEAIGARYKVHGVNTYPNDLRSELQGIQSEQYARGKGLPSTPNSRYSGNEVRNFRKDAADEIEQPTSSSAVLDFVSRYPQEVSKAEKEIPETYGDLRPVEGPIDPGNLFVPASLSGSRLQQDAVNIGNNRVFLKRYGDVAGVYPLRGDHGSFGVAIRISSISGQMLDDLKGLADYPSMDDAEASKAEHELIDDAWNDWAHFDFIRALENHLPDQEEKIDGLDDDQSRELFDRVRRRKNVEWSPDSTGMFIDVVAVAGEVTPEDLTD